MTDGTQTSGIRLRRFDPAWLALVFVPLVAWSKDATVVVLALGVVLMLVNATHRSDMLAGPHRPRFGAAFLIWVFASVGWSLAFPWIEWWKSFAVVAMAALLLRAIGRSDVVRLGQIAAAGLTAVTVLFGVLAVERLTGAGLIGLVRTAETTERLFNVMSGGLAFLCCLTFPAAYLIARRWSWSTAAIAILAVYVLALSYRMDAAPAAICTGAFMGAIVFFAQRKGFVAVVAVLVTLALGWGWLADFALGHGGGAWLAQNVSGNWAQRLEIWTSVSDTIAQRPTAGFGYDAGRALGRESGADVPYMHPHNGMLEAWLDFGLIGVVLLLGWIAATVRDVILIAPPREVLATIAATIAAAAVFWLVSFGLTAEWWLAALGLTFAALKMITRLAQPVT
ncbi:MAG: hypothetical protein KDE14_03220 [Rhodobacteraceae bacterium]|nr:hypothetical protein [Paracoccaceae bacterium]